jgi:hypothetical protein
MYENLELVREKYILHFVKHLFCEYTKNVHCPNEDGEVNENLKQRKIPYVLDAYE